MTKGRKQDDLSVFILLCLFGSKGNSWQKTTQPAPGVNDNILIYVTVGTDQYFVYYSVKDGNQLRIIDNWISTELLNKLEEFQIKTVCVPFFTGVYHRPLINILRPLTLYTIICRAGKTYMGHRGWSTTTIIIIERELRSMAYVNDY